MTRSDVVAKEIVESSSWFKESNCQFKRIIGSGTYGGKVALVQKNDEKYAFKLLIPDQLRYWEDLEGLKASMSEQAHENWKKRQEVLDKEVKSLQHLKHENIVEYITSGVEETQAYPLPVYYVVTKYVEGKPLRRIIDDKSSLEIHHCLDIATQILKAIDYATTRLPCHVIFHRDLQPSNIIIGGTENRLKVTILDYNLSKIHKLGRDIQVNSPYPDHHAYVPPHVWYQDKCDIEVNIDLYPVGIMLMELLLNTKIERELYDCKNEGNLSSDQVIKKIGEKLKRYRDRLAEELNQREDEYCLDKDKLIGVLEMATHSEANECYANAYPMLQDLIQIRRDYFLAKANQIWDSLEPQNPEGKRKKLEEAEDPFRQAMYWGNEDDYEAWNEYGVLLYHLDKLLEALECFERAVGSIERLLRSPLSPQKAKQLETDRPLVVKRRNQMRELLTAKLGLERKAGRNKRDSHWSRDTLTPGGYN